MSAAGVMLSNKLCPELGNRLVAMTWDQIETMIREFIAEDDCQRAQGATKWVIDRAKTRDYKADPIKFLSDLVHDLEKPKVTEVYCPDRGLDFRKQVRDQNNFYKGVNPTWVTGH